MARGRLWAYPCLIIGMGFLALTAPASGADETDARIKALEEQMARLQKELADLKAERERPPVTAAAPAAPVDASKGKDDGTPLRVFYKNGIKFKSDDGDFSLSVGGRVIENGRFFATSNPGSNTFYNKETQVILSGTVYKKFYYEFEGNLSGSPAAGTAQASAVLNNSFIRYTHNDFFGVTVGQFKVPFWYEETPSTLWRDFAEKSIGSVLAPSRDIGVQLQGKFLEKKVGYELGYFNSTVFNGSAKDDNDTIDDKTWAGRLTLTPFQADTTSPLNKLQLHGMFTWGRANGTAPKNFTAPDTNTTFLTWNAGTTVQQDVSRLGYGAFWANGPFNFKAEWETERLDLKRTGLTGPIDGNGNDNANTRFDAWYVTLGYNLTGEDANMGYDRLTPKNPWDKEGGYGAWQVLTRFSGFQAEREPFFNTDKQYASAPLPQDSNNNLGKTGSATSMNAWIVGLNWIPISNAKLFLNYGENYYGADYIGTPGADITKSEKYYLLSSQLDF